MQIRRVRPGDEAEWLRVRDALWPGLPAAHHHREMAGYLADEVAHAVFVLDRGDGRLGGFLEASTRAADGCETSPVGYIEGWYIDPGLRQSGWGGALAAAAEDWVRGRSYAEMASDCEVENLVSFQAHTALGYRETMRLVHFRKPLAGGD